jgi:hypothetical protein
MAWNTIADSLTADAADMNGNFNLVAAGTREPRSSAGVDMVTTNGVYDIGGSSSRWRTGYINNLDISGSVTTADKNLWILEAETTLSSPALSIEFTGLNGDDTNQYMIITRPKGFNTTVAGDLEMIINGDSAANYGYQYIRGEGTTVTAARGADIYVEICTFIGTSNTSAVGFGKVDIYAKTGNERTILATGLYNGIGTSITSVRVRASTWNNTASTITSLKFMSGILSYTMAADTNIQLWSRK